MRRQPQLPVLSTGSHIDVEREILPDDAPPPGISPQQVFAVLWAYRKHSLMIAASLLVLSMITIKLIPKIYSATATLMVNTDIRDPLAGKDPTGIAGGYIATEIQLMQSSEVLLPVIDQLQLTTVKEYVSGYRGRSSDASLRDWVKEKLVKDLDINQGSQGSLLINITASAREPFRAAQIANTIAEVYTKQQKQRTENPAVDRAKRYAEQLRELQQKVSIAQDQLAAFRQRTGVIDLSAQRSVESEVLAVMEHRLDDAQNERRTAEVRGIGNQAVSSGAMSSAVIQGLKTQLDAQEVKLAQLSSSLGARHPKVIELQSQIEATKRSLGTELGNYSHGNQQEVVATREFEQKQKAAIEAQRAKVLSMRKLQDEGNKYLLELDSAESVYKRALDGYDQIMFASNGHYNYVTMASRAVIPLDSSKPNKVKLFIVAILFSLASGLALPAAYEMLFDRRIRCVEDLERSFGVPVLVEFDSIHFSPGTA